MVYHPEGGLYRGHPKAAPEGQADLGSEFYSRALNPRQSTRMRNDETEQRSEWPKDVLIRQTLEAAAGDLEEDYDQESDGGDTLMNEVGESMDSLEIYSW